MTSFFDVKRIIPGVEIVAGYRLKLIQLMKQAAVLLFRYKKNAELISHWGETYFVISNNTFIFIYLYMCSCNKPIYCGEGDREKMSVALHSTIEVQSSWNSVHCHCNCARCRLRYVDIMWRTTLTDGKNWRQATCKSSNKPKRAV